MKKDFKFFEIGQWKSSKVAFYIPRNGRLSAELTAAKISVAKISVALLK